MIGLLLLFLAGFFLLLLVVFVFLRRTAIAPEIIVFFSSFVMVFLLAFRSEYHSELNVCAILLYVIGVLFLGVSAFFSSCGVSLRPESRALIVLSSKRLEFIILASSWFLFVFLIAKALELSQAGPFESNLRNLRWQVSSSEGDGFGAIGYARPFLTVVALREVVRQSYSLREGIRGLMRTALYVAPGFLAAFTSMGRGHVVGFVFAVMAILILVQRRTPAGLLVGGALFTLCVFGGLGVVLRKISQERDFLLASVDAMIDYLSLPLVAWSLSFADSESFGWGVYTFRIIWAIGETLGLPGVEAMPTVRDFVSIRGAQTNLYTFLFPYYKDFGVVGVVAISSVVGGLVGILYKLALKGKSPAWLILYGLSVAPLLSVFSGEKFFVLASQWGQYLVWSFLLTIGWALQLRR